MSYIVVDFEFNQAYDFKNNCDKGYLKECRFEIIQIGAVKLNRNFDLINQFNSYIRPTIYKNIHPYVKKITSITEEILKDKDEFKNVFMNFANFINIEKNFILCVWGNNDIKTLYKNLKYHKIINKNIIIKYIDVQSLTNSYLNYKKGNYIGLKTATELLNISSQNNFHNALNDAIYTAKILKKISPCNIPLKVFNSKNI